MTGCIYEDLRAIGARISNNHSDLYTPYTPEAVAIVKKHKGFFDLFTNQVEGGLWMSIAFAYQPFWDDVNRKSLERALHSD